MDMHWVATDFGDLDLFALQPVEVASPGSGEVSG
jgi:hypothetical protein